MSFLTGVLLLGVVTALACALPGVFVVLRRGSMLVDAMSHAVLPGIVAGFALAGSLDSPLLVLGAALSGLAVVLGAQWLGRTGLVAGDAPQGLVFPALFSVGVLLVSARFSGIHLDEHAVLVGDLNLAAFRQLELGGASLGPSHMWLMLGVLGANALFIGVFWRRLVAGSVDPEFAAVAGQRPWLTGTAFMLLVSITVTAAFHAVGSVLVLALVVVPAACARLFCRRLPTMIAAALLIAASGAVLGFWIAYRLDAPTSAAMAVCYGVGFAAVFALRAALRRRRRHASSTAAAHTASQAVRPSGTASPGSPVSGSSTRTSTASE